jgi:hypothetical protein
VLQDECLTPFYLSPTQNILPFTQLVCVEYRPRLSGQPRQRAGEQRRPAEAGPVAGLEIGRADAPADRGGACVICKA